MTHPSVPVANVRELVAYARAHPGALNYASGTVGSTNHLAAELFKALAGVNIARVGYKGSGFAVNDLIGGQVDFSFPSTAAALPHVQSGKLRGIAVTTEKRSSVMGDLPALAPKILKGEIRGRVVVDVNK